MTATAPTAHRRKLGRHRHPGWFSGIVLGWGWVARAHQAPSESRIPPAETGKTAHSHSPKCGDSLPTFSPV